MTAKCKKGVHLWRKIRILPWSNMDDTHEVLVICERCRRKQRLWFTEREIKPMKDAKESA